MKYELGAMNEVAIEGLEVSASRAARQVYATYLHDDCNLGVSISLAEAHPLHVVDVHLTSHLGVRDDPLLLAFCLSFTTCARASDVGGQVAEDAALDHNSSVAQGRSSAFCEMAIRPS